MLPNLQPQTGSYDQVVLGSDSQPPQTSAVSRVFSINELLIAVFISCLEEGGDLDDDLGKWTTLTSDTRSRYPRPSENEVPLLLAHVCRHWRNVALDIPRLWARLHLEFSARLCQDIPRMEGQLCALKFWLTHSRSIPISTRLRISWIRPNQLYLTIIPPESRLILTKIVETLFKHTHRWENIEISLLEFGLMPFYQNISQQYPRLLSLKLDNRVYPMKEALDGKDLLDSFLYSAPKVKELVLPGRGVGYFDSDMFAPFAFPSSLQSLELSDTTMHITRSVCGSHLRELILKNVLVSNLAKFPIAFPLLETLIVVYDRELHATWDVIYEREDDEEEDDEDEDDNPGLRYAVLDHLTTLKVSVHCGQERGVPQFLFGITAFALKHLAFSEHTTSRNPEYDIFQLLHRSQAPVEYFSYKGSDNTNSVLSEDAIRLILEEMPGLIELDFHQPAFSNALSFLGDPAHLPQLTNIHSEGDLPVIEDVTDESLHTLSRLHVRDILRIIERRCRKRHEPDNGERVWLKKLAVPVYEEQERLIRENEIFRQSEVEFENTYEWQDGLNEGEDICPYY